MFTSFEMTRTPSCVINPWNFSSNSKVTVFSEELSPSKNFKRITFISFKCMSRVFFVDKMKMFFVDKRIAAYKTLTGVLNLLSSNGGIILTCSTISLIYSIFLSLLSLLLSFPFLFLFSLLFPFLLFLYYHLYLFHFPFLSYSQFLSHPHLYHFKLFYLKRRSWYSNYI